jgi:HK97 family phage portal protein
VITRPKESGTIGQDAINNIVSTFKERHSGVRNKFGVAMLQEGMDYKQMAMTHEQAQLIESRKLSVADISRLYGIPLALLNETAGESYKSVEQNTLNYLTFALMPWIRRWESAMHRDLLQPSERKKYFIEFNFSGLIRGDIKTRYDAYAIARQWGWLSLNDIRRLENLPPVTGGDVYLTPLNMVDTKNQKIHEQINTATPEQLKEIETLCRI